ncbi:Wall-associated receptor kinase 5 [Abeliophyllum distichum]|uniref:Wall-associated receptor kinase 5 n=1 Tax=Abeliophyllum distichum TaxID=126358 RepID=A0ABD1VR57_9LAMI
MSKHSAMLHMLFLLSVAVELAPRSNAARGTITKSTSTKPGCQSRCGNIQVPYPFGIGIGSNCSISSPWFDINCNNSFNPPKPYLAYTPFEVVNITNSQIYVKNWRLQMAVACYSREINNKTEEYSIINISHFSNSPYTLSRSNQITTVGCDDLATVRQLSNLNGTNRTSTACTPYCEGRDESSVTGSCPGTGCCRTFISRATVTEYLIVRLYNMYSIWRRHEKLFRCSFAFVGVANSSDHFTFRLSVLNDPKEFVNNKKFTGMPMVLNWTVGSQNCTKTHNPCKKNSFCINSSDGGYHCACKRGYEGNPYLSPGCQGVGLGSGIGLLLLLLTCFRLCKFQKRRRNKKRKQKFFKRNGGLLLQQQISTDGDILEKTRLFTSKELEKATDRFNESRILGKGGQGTVYKDPEYFQSSQFTEKSDVYSFGVVLVELLTGQRPISLDRSGEQRSLATRFLLCMEGENLETILDTQVLEQGNREELIAVAKLAQMCLNLSGKKRPTMKEVAMELESVRMSQTLSTACETKYQVVQLHKSKSILTSDDDYTWTSTSEYPISSSDTCPLKIHTV